MVTWPMASHDHVRSHCEVTWPFDLQCTCKLDVCVVEVLLWMNVLYLACRVQCSRRERTWSEPGNNRQSWLTAREMNSLSYSSTSTDRRSLCLHSDDDSAVSAYMLNKNSVLLGSYLPYLNISYRSSLNDWISCSQLAGLWLWKLWWSSTPTH